MMEFAAGFVVAAVWSLPLWWWDRAVLRAKLDYERGQVDTWRYADRRTDLAELGPLTPPNGTKSGTVFHDWPLDEPTPPCESCGGPNDQPSEEWCSFCDEAYEAEKQCEDLTTEQGMWRTKQ